MTPLSEAQFQAQILDLAHLLGWETFHVRAGRTADSWRVPGSGTMAKGWPDLVLVHPVQRRLMFVELKADKGQLTAHQERVMDVLREVESYPHPKWAGTGREGEIEVSCHVWRPVNWPLIQETLSERKAA